jgi:hypothetical protein
MRLLASEFIPCDRSCTPQRTSAIVGQVTDATSAVVPDAMVTITNQETGLKRNAKTDNASRAWCWPAFRGTPLRKQDLERSPIPHLHPLACSALA